MSDEFDILRTINLRASELARASRRPDVSSDRPTRLRTCAALVLELFTPALVSAVCLVAWMIDSRLKRVAELVPARRHEEPRTGVALKRGKRKAGERDGEGGEGGYMMVGAHSREMGRSLLAWAVVPVWPRCRRGAPPWFISGVVC
jgi:hypothetical protein